MKSFEVKRFGTFLEDKPPLREVEYKGFGLTKEPIFLLWEIHSLDDKAVPHELTSKFTRPDLARDWIDKYLERTNK